MQNPPWFFDPENKMAAFSVCVCCVYRCITFVENKEPPSCLCLLWSTALELNPSEENPVFWMRVLRMPELFVINELLKKKKKKRKSS